MSNVLFEQGPYTLSAKSDLTGYQVVNKETGVIEKVDSSLGYAIFWLKHLDFVLGKSKTTDPDLEQEAQRKEFEGRGKTQIPLPGLGPNKE
jgi:hypothetical protein